MVGGTGNDQYRINDPGDRITENAGEGVDTVLSTISVVMNSVARNVENIELLGRSNRSASGTSDDNKMTGNAGDNSLSGGGGDDELIGGRGEDTLNGGSGNDTLNGGAGADTMIGGSGDDTFMVNSTSDVVTEAADGGTDTVITTISTVMNVAAANTENLFFLGRSNLSGSGTSADNVMTGNIGNNNLRGGGGDDELIGGKGLDTLVGGSGDDTLNGGAGADTMVGGSGNDVYVMNSTTDVVTELAGEGIDSVETRVSLVMNVSARNVENLTMAGASDLSASGTGAANVMIGNRGDNVLNGGGGDDTLSGGSGNDTINGGGGNDFLTGNGGFDTFVFSNNWGEDTIAGYNLAAAEDIDLSGVDAITNFSDLTANHLRTAEDGSAVIFSGSNSITLLGVTEDDLANSDFIF